MPCHFSIDKRPITHQLFNAIVFSVDFHLYQYILILWILSHCSIVILALHFYGVITFISAETLKREYICTVNFILEKPTYINKMRQAIPFHRHTTHNYVNLFICTYSFIHTYTRIYVLYTSSISYIYKNIHIYSYMCFIVYMLSILLINVFSSKHIVFIFLQVIYQKFTCTKWNIYWHGKIQLPIPIYTETIPKKKKLKNKPLNLASVRNVLLNLIFIIEIRTHRRWARNIEVIDIMRTTPKSLRPNHREHQRILCAAWKDQPTQAVNHPLCLHPNPDTIEYARLPSTRDTSNG